MKILIAVHCSDGIVEVCYDYLIQYDFFQKYLTFNPLKLEKESNHYIYKIPVLTVACSKLIFSILLDDKIKIGPDLCINFIDDDGNHPELIDLMYYNSLYKMTTITYNGYDGYNSKRYFTLYQYVEDKLPNVNPYEFIENSMHHFFNDILDYNMSDMTFKLNNKRIVDILASMRKYEGFLQFYKPFHSSGTTINSFMMFIVNCWTQGYSEFFKQTCKLSLQHLKYCYKQLIEYADNYSHYVGQEKRDLDKLLQSCPEVTNYLGIVISDSLC